MPMMWIAITVIVGAYLIGAIPFGYVLVRQLKGLDIRDHGSGGTGATNVKRVAGKTWGLVTLLLDCIKGALSVFLAMWLIPSGSEWAVMAPVGAAIAAVLGHSKSIYIGFTGGKSVATSLGAALVLQPIATLSALVLAGLVIKLTRYVSLGSMIGVSLFPLIVYVLHGPLVHVGLGVVIALYVIYLHRDNIQRLMTQQENRL